MKFDRWCLILVGMCVFSCVGCGRILQGSLQPPGTVFQQRNRAVLFDPYPSDDFGPPIVGGRPREFSQPFAEARGNQILPKAY